MPAPPVSHAGTGFGHVVWPMARKYVVWPMARKYVVWPMARKRKPGVAPFRPRPAVDTLSPRLFFRRGFRRGCAHGGGVKRPNSTTISRYPWEGNFSARPV